MQQKVYPNKSSKTLYKGLLPLAWLATALIVLGAGGYGIVMYLHHGSPSTSNATDNTATNSPATGSPSAGGSTGTPNSQGCSTTNPCTGSSNSSQQSPVNGTVTAFSASSITVKSSGGSTQTLAITSNTQESSGPGEAKAYSPNDMHVGESVEVVLGPGNQAMFIVLNSSAN